MNLVKYIVGFLLTIINFFTGIYIGKLTGMLQKDKTKSQLEKTKTINLIFTLLLSISTVVAFVQIYKDILKLVFAPEFVNGGSNVMLAWTIFNAQNNIGLVMKEFIKRVPPKTK